MTNAALAVTIASKCALTQRVASGASAILGSCWRKTGKLAKVRYISVTPPAADSLEHPFTFLPFQSYFLISVDSVVQTNLVMAPFEYVSSLWL